MDYTDLVAKDEQIHQWLQHPANEQSQDRPFLDDLDGEGWLFSAILLAFDQYCSTYTSYQDLTIIYAQQIADFLRQSIVEFYLEQLQTNGSKMQAAVLAQYYYPHWLATLVNSDQLAAEVNALQRLFLAEIHLGVASEL